jgi:hypothetical protein
MALVLADRVQQTGTANTTVSFTLSGSVTGFQSFVVVGDANTTYYSATDSSGNWETGLGTYSTTGPTLTRTTIYQSSNSNTAVTFSGTVNVFVTYPSQIAVTTSTIGSLTSLAATSAPINAQTSAYVLVAEDAGKTISITTGGVTIPASVLSAGNLVTVYNNSTSNQTITQGGGLTLQFAGQTGSTTGNRTLGLYGICTVLFLSGTSAVITGGGLS